MARGVRDVINEPGDNVKNEEKREQVQIKRSPPPSTSDMDRIRAAMDNEAASDCSSAAGKCSQMFQGIQLLDEFSNTGWPESIYTLVTV